MRQGDGGAQGENKERDAAAAGSKTGGGGDGITKRKKERKKARVKLEPFVLTRRSFLLCFSFRSVLANRGVFSIYLLYQCVKGKHKQSIPLLLCKGQEGAAPSRAHTHRHTHTHTHSVKQSTKPVHHHRFFLPKRRSFVAESASHTSKGRSTGGRTPRRKRPYSFPYIFFALR